MSPPEGRHLCHSLARQAMGRLAEVIVTFGRLGAGWPDALWPDCWYRWYPMCAQCRETTRQVTEQHRPALVFTGPAPAERA